MWLSVAAETPVPQVSDQIIVMVGTVITAAIVALGGVMVAIVNSRAARTAPSPPSPTGEGTSDHVLYERTAVLSRRADDADERDEVQDRRLDQIERVLDMQNPKWRRI